MRKNILRTTIMTLVVAALLMGTTTACFQKKDSAPAGSGAATSTAEGGIAGADPIPTVSRQTELADATAQNSDTVAWLYLPDTEIDDPIVQAADNEYYLNRDETGSYSAWGCYFADYLNDLSGRAALDTNTVIYGHSYKTEDPDERKFTQLFKYCDLEFVQQHPYIYLSVNGEDLVFQVAAVFFTDIDFDYINPEPSGEDLTTFFDTVEQKNEYVFDGLDFGPGDKVLTLSTCAHRYDVNNTRNQRLVVMAKLLDAGVTEQAVTVKANANPERP